MGILRTCFGLKAKIRAVLLLVAAGLCLSLVLPVAPALAQKPAASDDDVFELILQVQRKRLKKPEVLASALLGLQKGLDGYYLPLKDLADIVDFDVKSDLAKGRMEGWYFSPDNAFVVDTREGYYTKDGARFDLTPDDFIIRDYGGGFGDIYIRYETLNKIWPLDLALDFSKLKLDIQTPHKLAYEIQRDREAQRDRLLSLQQKGNYKGFKIVPNDYRMLSAPVIDLTGGYNFGHAENGSNGFLNVTGKNDLLGFSADYNFNIDYQPGHIQLPKDIRLTMTRYAYGDETMPLGLRRVSVGDVGAPTADLISGSNSGRGISVSSSPVKRQGTFDEVTIEGTGHPGWEIELYNNGELLEYGEVSKDGQYRYDVDLNAGGNNIRVVLYGPHGEVEEQNHFYNVGGLVPPGETEYEMALVDTSDNLISIEDDNSANLPNSPTKGYAYSGRVTHGVNRWLSVFATGSRSMLGQKGRVKHVTAGANMSLGGVQAKVEALQELGGGHALDSRVSTSMLGWNLNVRTAFLSNFESTRVGFGDNADTLRVEGRAGKRFPFDFGSFGIRLNGSYQKEKDGDRKSNYQVSTSFNHGPTRLGNALRFNYRNGIMTAVSGILNGSQRLGKKTRVRSILNYNVKPSFELVSLNSVLNYSYSRKLTSSFDWTHNLLSKGDTYGAALSYDFGYFLGSIDTSWDTNQGSSVSLRASTSLAPFGRDGGYTMSSDNRNGQNAIRAALFRDANLNGLFDEGEDALPGTRLLLDGRHTDKADEGGLLANIDSSNGDYTAITFDRESADNPFYAMEEEGYVMLRRPGVAQNLEVPIVETGMIDGTVYFDNGKPVPGLRLELVRMKDGLVANKTITTFDGFYTFQYVKPGAYVVQAAPSVEARVSRQVIVVTPDNLFNYGINLDLPVPVDMAAVRSNYGAILNNLKKLQSTLSSAVDGS